VKDFGAKVVVSNSKILFVSPRIPGRWANLTSAYFPNGLKLNHQLGDRKRTRSSDLSFGATGSIWISPFGFGHIELKPQRKIQILFLTMLLVYGIYRCYIVLPWTRSWFYLRVEKTKYGTKEIRICGKSLSIFKILQGSARRGGFV